MTLKGFIRSSVLARNWVKRTCAELGVSYKTLRKYKESGYIKPLNPDNASRPKYSGQSIIDCWKLLTTL